MDRYKGATGLVSKPRLLFRADETIDTYNIWGNIVSMMRL